MKKYLFAILFNLAFANITFAAICSCDAPPSCGTPPASCFNLETRMLVRKTFEEQSSAYPKKLRILKILSTGALSVNYGGPLDGRPLGQYFIRITSDHTFNLELDRSPKSAPVIVDKFNFTVDKGEVQEIENREGTLFLPVP
jgi:hypothetical protein